MTPDYLYDNCALCNQPLPTNPPKEQLSKVAVLKQCEHRADVACIEKAVNQSIHCLACEYEKSATNTTSFSVRIYRSYKVGENYSDILSLLCLGVFWIILITPITVEVVMSNEEEQRLARLRDPNYVHVVERLRQKMFVMMATGVSYSTINLFYRVFAGKNISESKVMKKCMGGVSALFSAAVYPFQKSLKTCRQRNMEILN